jgi:hypothetical protein
MADSCFWELGEQKSMGQHRLNALEDFRRLAVTFETPAARSIFVAKLT